MAPAASGDHEGAGDGRQACPACGATAVEDVFPKASGPVRRWPLVRCASCALIRLRRLPSDEDLSEAYRGYYGAPAKRFVPAIECLVSVFGRSRLRCAKRLLPRHGKVLDIGCGRGTFLRMLQAQGHEVQGVELSTSTAANVVPGVPVDVGEVAPGRYPEASFDLISIWHVLEHLRWPDQTLKACAGMLKPGGKLMLAVPNVGSLQARWGGARWFHLDVPRHVYHFTPDTLRRLLERCGFTVCWMRTGQWEMDPFGWIQTALNRVGLRHNILYDTLRNHPDVKRDVSTAARAALLLAFVIGMPVACVVSAACRAAGVAGTIRAVAEPRRDEPGAGLSGRLRKVGQDAGQNGRRRAGGGPRSAE